MTEHKRLVENIQKKMAFYISNLRISNDRDYFDENKEAEYFFCKPLSLLFDAEVTNVNSEQRNFPGIDLADRKEGICFQITSTNTKKKIQHTLDEFLDHDLDKDFDRLIVLIATLDTPPKCSTLTHKRDFDFDVKRDVWNISRLVQEFENLPFEKRHVLQAFSDYLDKEMPGIETRKPHLELPPHSTLEANDFVGREQELAEIGSRFHAGGKQVVLTGLGGMGKTELAVQYGRQHEGKVHFARFDTNFTRTLANMAQGIRPALSDDQLRQDEKLLCALVLKLLENADSRDLLIIDNADSPTGDLESLLNDDIYHALAKAPLGLLVTTRSAYSRAIRIEPMEDGPLFEIFKKHGAGLGQAEMKALIDAVNGHTLTVDLMARTLSAPFYSVSAGDMLNAIRNSSLSDEDLPEVGTDYAQSKEQLHIYQRLRTVFQMSNLSEMEEAILQYAVLLPQAGMDVKLFRSALSDEERKVFPTLGKRGWFTDQNHVLSIHPVIRLVCRTELKPSEQTCEDFLDRLWAQYDQTKYNYSHYCQMAELFTDASDALKAKHGRWINRSAILWLAVSQYQKLCDLYASRISDLENHLPPDSLDLATAYNYFGLGLGTLGQYRLALDYVKKALAIREAVLDPDDPEVARSYNNVGDAHGNLGELQTALEYKLRALDILRKSLPADHPDLATSCAHVGNAYRTLGNYKKALEFQLEAKAIWERVLPEDHPNLANSYNDVGYTYGMLGNHQKALEFQLRAMEIRERVLPEDHPDLANSYSHVGHTYGMLGNHQKALEFQLKAMGIWERVLPEEHPNLAGSYNNVGCTYYKMGMPEKALPLFRRALEIYLKAFPDGHPYIDRVRKSIQLCEANIRIRENLARAGVYLTRLFGQFPILPPFKK